MDDEIQASLWAACLPSCRHARPHSRNSRTTWRVSSQLALEVLPGRIHSVLHPGARERAAGLQKTLEEAAAFFEGRIGVAPTFALAVLNEVDWAKLRPIPKPNSLGVILATCRRASGRSGTLSYCARICRCSREGVGRNPAELSTMLRRSSLGASRRSCRVLNLGPDSWRKRTPAAAAALHALLDRTR